MNIKKIFFLILLLVSFLYSDSNNIKTGLLYEKIFTTKKEAAIGSMLWTKQMDNKKYKNKMEIVFYDDKKKLLEDYKNNKIHVIVIDAISYYENKKLIDKLSKTKWILSRIESMFEQFYLVKNSNSNIDLNKLNAKKIFHKSELAKIWMETILYRNSKKIKKRLFEKIEKPKKLIFNIFFNQNNLSIIPKDVYDSMADLNPQIKDKITIIKKSKPLFFGAIGFTRKNLNKDFMDTLELVTSDVNNTINELEAISFVNIQNIFTVKDGDLDDLDKFYNEYISFKNKKGK